MTTYYVRKTGLDSHGGLSPSDAFLTINKALSVMSGSTDIVYIGAGTYDETFAGNSSANGVSGSLQRYIGDIKGVYTGDAGSINVKSYRNVTTSNFQSYEYLNFNSFAAGPSPFDTENFSGYLQPPAVVLAQYEFIGCRFGNTFTINDISNVVCVLFFDCTFGEDVIYKNTVLTASCWIGRAKTIQFCNCTFYSPLGSYYALHMLHPYAADVRNCIFIKATNSTTPLLDYTFNAQEYSNFTSDYNFYQSGSAPLIRQTISSVLQYAGLSDWLAATPFDDHSLTGIAGFTSASFGSAMDFHLPVSSPCINAGFARGVSSSINFPNLVTSDWEQQARNVYWDIGADQSIPIIAVTQSLLSNAYVLPYSTANPNVFNFSSPIEAISTSFVNLTTFDLKLKHDCNHVLSSGTYTLNTCSRCLGNGYYYDIKLSPDGYFITTDKVNKLRQELEKITLTESNPFHSDYGINLQSRVGQVPIDGLKAIIESDLRNAVAKLKNLQEVNIGINIFSPDELIAYIDSVIVTESGQTGLVFTVNIVTKSALNITLQGTIDTI